MFKKSYLPYGKIDSGVPVGFDWLSLLQSVTVTKVDDTISVSGMSWDKTPDSPEIEYQWQYSSDGEEYSDIDGAVSGSYSLLLSDSNGMYRCTVTVRGTAVHPKTINSNSVSVVVAAVYGYAIYGVSKYSIEG